MDAEREGELDVACPKRGCQESLEARWPINGQRRFDVCHPEGHEEAGQAENVVAVEMANEDGLQTAPPQTGFSKADLGSFACIQENPAPSEP